MNRRELLQSVAAVAAAGGVTIDRASAVDAEPAPVFAVIEARGPLSDATAARLRAMLADTFKGTSFEATKVLVLDASLKLTFLDRAGHVCNEQIDTPAKGDD